MLFEISEDHRQLQAKARELAEKWGDRAPEIRRWPFENRTLHPGLWRDFSDAGFAGLLIPSEHGGSDQGLLALTLVLEALAGRAVMPSLSILSSLGTLLVRLSGSEALQAELLPQVARGDLTFAVAVTEADAGQNFLAMETVIEKRGDRVRIDGEKAFTLGVEVADRLLVVGRSQPAQGAGKGLGGSNVVLLDPQTPGLKMIELPMGGRQGLRQWILRFRGCEVPASQLVGEEHEAASRTIKAFDAERVLFCAWALGITAHCLRRAVERASTRVVFGDRPIGSYQAIQHPLAEIDARLSAARLLTYRAAALYDAGAPHEVFWPEVFRAKILCADLVDMAADQAIQTFGGAGFNEDEGLVQLYLDARAFRVIPISQEVARKYLSEHVLKLPRSA